MKTIFNLVKIRAITDVLLNKYIVAGTIFSVWLGFFDKYSMSMQWKLSHTINELQDQKQWLESAIIKTDKQHKDLADNLEKYAREKYYMKKPGEEIYIIQ